MTVRFAARDEIEAWDGRILANPDGGNVFQSDEFAEQKKLSGWKPRYVVANDCAITVLEKSVFGIGKFWYIPKGPGVKSIVQLGDMLPELKDLANENGVFAIKIEPELEKTEDTMKAAAELGLLPVTPIQPNSSTVLIDLSPDPKTIMANFNQTSRHAMRRAEREGVTIELVETSSENCKTFYNLLASTAEGSFVIRSYEYYFKFWRRYSDTDQGQLFFAYYDGKLVAAAFTLVFGEKSTYKDGASIREKTVYGASHLLQLHAMQWARRRGSKIHDLCGTPPSDRINDETHPHYGIGKFKTSFNKQVTDYVGAFDIVVRPRQYGWWVKFGERAAKSLWWRKHHESWY